MVIDYLNDPIRQIVRKLCMFKLWQSPLWRVPLTAPIFCVILGLIVMSKMITCTQMWGFLGGAINGTHFCLFFGPIVMSNITTGTQIWASQGVPLTAPHFVSHFWSDCYKQIGNMYADLGHHGAVPLTAPHLFSHFVSGCYEQNDNMYADLGDLRGCRER